MALSRVRSPADKAAREKEVQEAERAVASLEASLEAAVESGKSLQQARREHEAVLAAQRRLEENPNDAEACLVVGRWLSFERGDWDKGLKLLAKGSDDVLKSLAAGDLEREPSMADQRVARGDAWWDAADKSQGRDRIAMRRRAGHWYEEARPNLSGPVKKRAEMRLLEVAEEPATKGDPSPAALPLAVAPFDETTARLHQTRWARHLRVPVVYTNSIGMRFVLIPPGEFMMGSPDSEEGRRENESPQHRVRITKPFYLGLSQVTQAEYARVMGSNPSKFKDDATLPVEQVTWYEAVEFCHRLGELLGEKAARAPYRLPTEAEWEYACRAGTTTRYSLGDDEAILVQYAWRESNSQGRTQPVGRLKPNTFGLFDMHGNVCEWCSDWYAGDYYAGSPAEDPPGPDSGTDRVMRGGSWDCASAVNFRCAYRDAFGPGRRYKHIGFRVARALRP